MIDGGQKQINDDFETLHEKAVDNNLSLLTPTFDQNLNDIRIESITQLQETFW